MHKTRAFPWFWCSAILDILKSSWTGMHLKPNKSFSIPIGLSDFLHSTPTKLLIYIRGSVLICLFLCSIFCRNVYSFFVLDFIKWRMDLKMFKRCFILKLLEHGSSKVEIEIKSKKSAYSYNWVFFETESTAGSFYWQIWQYLGEKFNTEDCFCGEDSKVHFGGPQHNSKNIILTKLKNPWVKNELRIWLRIDFPNR